MWELYIVNHKFLYKILQIKEDSVNLYDYSNVIQKLFEIRPEYQIFFFEGNRINEISKNQDSDHEIQVVDISLYRLNEINISVHNYPSFYSKKLSYIESGSLQDGLRMFVDLKRLSSEFNRDFSISNEEFSSILSKPLAILREINFKFTLKTETIKIIFDQKTYNYEANLKIKIINLIPKLKLFFNAVDRDLIIKDWNLKERSPDQRLSAYLPENENKIIYCEIKNSTEEGLLKIYSCQNRLCNSYSEKHKNRLGYGMFDLKKIYYNTKCLSCDAFPDIKFESKNCQVFNDCESKSLLVNNEQDLLKNFLPSLWVFFTCICL